MAAVDTDVLIVGGGPTGGMLALELARNNISFRIIDSAASRSDKSRAVVVHPRSLELLNRHGLAEEFIRRGRYNSAVKLFSQKAFIFKLEFKEMVQRDSAFPGPLMLSQADTEDIFDEALAKYGGKKVERPVTLSRMEQDENGVFAWLTNANGQEEEVRCRYVVGCDGTRSVVRISAGLSFEGGAYPQDFILADVKAKWDLWPCLHLFVGDVGFLVVIPLKDGYFRVIGSRPQGADISIEPTLKDFKVCCANLVPGEVELTDPTWISKFNLHHRTASSYRSGRLFLAGDAAHIHSPVMNTGIQDAANLGWKLAAVLKSQVPAADIETFLDSYNMECHKVGEKLLNGTDKIFKLMATRNPIYLFLRNWLLPLILPIAMRNPELRQKRFRFVSQLAIRYRNSPIVGQASTWAGKLRGGDRTPNGKIIDKHGEETMLLNLCRGPQYHLLQFYGTPRSAVSEAAIADSGTLTGYMVPPQVDPKSVLVYHSIMRAQSVTDYKDDEDWHADTGGLVHELYGFGSEGDDGRGYVLVRPDGHIAWIGNLASVLEMEEALRGWGIRVSHLPNNGE